ncbi:MRG-domain-containing protein [Scheffersomyces coipomensis]|uniref:MRG-domain-containing protein n=1 Tax=Scheffersomyces coipomensis TaxID=1788519 RepID=UPI00315C5F1D
MSSTPAGASGTTNTIFKPNSTVYAYHGPLIYESKVLKVYDFKQDKIINHEFKREQFKENLKFNRELFKVNQQDGYFLHYQGWNSKWDEWVNSDRILEFNDMNKFKKTELDQLNKKKKVSNVVINGGVSTGISTGNNNNNNGSSSGSKRKEGSEGLTGSNGNSNGSNSKKQKTSTPANVKNKGNPTIQLDFNIKLKYILINDWEFITKDKKILDLPSKAPISKILQDYKSFREPSLDSHQQQILSEILLGLELYFNKSLSLILLYKYENLQYLNFLKQDLISKDKIQSKVYGYEHLLRLLISLPGLISESLIDTISLNVLIDELNELLKFLTNNMNDYINEYNNTSPQYDSLARS